MWLRASEDEIDDSHYRHKRKASKSSLKKSAVEGGKVEGEGGGGKGERRLVGRGKEDLRTYFLWMNRSPRGFGWMTR